MRDLPADVLEQRLVDVQPAEVGQAALGEHHEALLGGADDRHVERAGAQVVDGQRLVGREGLAGKGGEVRGRGHRLGHQHEVGPHAGLPRRGQQHVAPHRAPLRRVGQPHLVRLGAAELAGGLVEDPAQHAGERVGDRHDLVAEQQRALVDAALGVGLEASGVEPGAAFGVPADHEVTVLGGEHGGGHHRRPVHVDNPRRAAVRGQHGNRVGRAEIHRQDVHDSPLVRPRPGVTAPDGAHLAAKMLP